MANVVKNLYRGWVIQDGEHVDIPRVRIEDIEPIDFYNKYVYRRRPCVIIGFPKTGLAVDSPTKSASPCASEPRQNVPSKVKRRRIIPPSEFKPRASRVKTDVRIAKDDVTSPQSSVRHETFTGTPFDLSNNVLRDLAGDYTVKVELDDTTRKGTAFQRSQRFGKGKSVRMMFADFLERVESGDESLYLSTQNLDESEDGSQKSCPLLSMPPATQIVRAGYLPVHVDLMGHLILSSVNTWMGRSAKGSSSGLHHDFHDNLYVLLRGKKTFQLWSPDSALAMCTAGTISHVYENGRICYVGDDNVNADGSWIPGENSLSGIFWVYCVE